MTNFDETQHPRIDDGTFAQKFQSPPETATLKAANDHIQKICYDAGLDGIMPQVISIIRDRGEVKDSEFDALTSADITNMYDESIAKGVDAAERHLLDLAIVRDDEDNAEPIEHEVLAAHIKKVTGEAWSEAMEQVLLIIRDREEVTDQTLMSVTVEDVVDMNDSYLIPAVDRAQRDIGDDDDDEDGSEDR